MKILIAVTHWATAFVAAAILTACGDARQTVSQAPTPSSTEQVPKAAAQENVNDGQPLPDLATDNVAFLVRLGLVRGHLHAGNALYQQDETEMAATHMKHPRDELYAGLVPAIEARGMQPFDAELTALAEAVETGADAERVAQAWDGVEEAIVSIEQGIDASPREELQAIAGMLDTAAEEYRAGVFDAMVKDVHEYQDSWGFQQIALARVGRIETTSENERSAKAEAAVTVSSLDDLWTGLNPANRVGGDADRIAAAADRIRSAASDLG